MKPNQLIAMLLSITAYLIGVIAGIFLIPAELSFFIQHNYFNALALTLLPFIFSFAFFGFISFIPMFFLGVLAKDLIYLNPVLFALTLIPIAIAVYSGSLLGETIWNELKEGKGLKQEWKKIIALIAIALILAVLIAYATPSIEMQLNLKELISGMQL